MKKNLIISPPKPASLEDLALKFGREGELTDNEKMIQDDISYLYEFLLAHPETYNSESERRKFLRHTDADRLAEKCLSLISKGHKQIHNREKGRYPILGVHSISSILEWVGLALDRFCDGTEFMTHYEVLKAIMLPEPIPIDLEGSTTITSILLTRASLYRLNIPQQQVFRNREVFDLEYAIVDIPGPVTLSDMLYFGLNEDPPSGSNSYLPPQLITSPEELSRELAAESRHLLSRVVRAHESAPLADVQIGGLRKTFSRKARAVIWRLVKLYEQSALEALNFSQNKFHQNAHQIPHGGWAVMADKRRGDEIHAGQIPSFQFSSKAKFDEKTSLHEIVQNRKILEAIIQRILTMGNKEMIVTIPRPSELEDRKVTDLIAA